MAKAKEVERGILDPVIQPGFECYFSPHLDKERLRLRSIVNTLAQRGCAQLYIPVRFVQGTTSWKPLNTAPFGRKFLDGSIFRRIAEETVNLTSSDILVVCEDTEEASGSTADLFGWIHYAHRPYGIERMCEATTSLETPLGRVTIEGPQGPISFNVEKLLNRHYADGETRTVTIVDDIYQLSVFLDDLADGTEYAVKCEGALLSFNDSDERTVCLTCESNGIAFGIGAFDPTDGYWENSSMWEGYLVEANYGDPDDTPIRFIPVPQNRDRVGIAIFWVAWIRAWEGAFGPWANAEDALSYFLT